MMYDSVALLCLTFSQTANYENGLFFFPFLQLSSYYERLKIRFRQTLLDSQEIQNETINTAFCSMDVLGTPNSSSRRKEGRTQLRVGWLCLPVILLLLLKQRISKVPDIEIP